jgi:hypothetical protein
VKYTLYPSGRLGCQDDKCGEWHYGGHEVTEIESKDFVVASDNQSTVIDTYFAAKNEIHKLMGYVPDWVEIPMSDERGQYWMLPDGEESGKFVWSRVPFTSESIIDGKSIYSGLIYTQRFLSKYVYRTHIYVMVSLDTQTDGNKFLAIFDADKECQDRLLMDLYKERW